MSKDGFIPPHGNDRAWLSGQKAEVVHDVAFRFCHKFLKLGDRTMDQMIQAARSGKQNIPEGAEFSGISTELEIQLTGAARSSLKELLRDDEDCLRGRNLRQWDQDSTEARQVRRLGSKPGVTCETFRELVETRLPEVVANLALCLLNQANYLPDQQLRRLEQDFLKEGGLRERLTRARLAARAKQH